MIVMPRVLSSLPLLAITVLIACGESESGDSDVNDGLDGGMDAPNVPSLPDVGMDANRMDIGLEDRPGISVDASLEASSDASDAKDSETDGPVEAGSDAADGSALDGSFDGGLVEHLACYYGDFDTEATYQLACLTFPGPLRSLVDALELQDTQILSATFAPHANEIALAVRDAPDAPIRLVIINLDDTTKSFELLAAPSADREVTDLAYSSDGTWLGFIADFELAGTRSMYVVALSGGLARRVSPTPEPGRDVVGFAWSDSTLTSSWLAYTGDLTAAGVRGLWTIDVSTPTSPAQTIISDADLDEGDVQKDLMWDGQGRILFRSNHGPDGTFALYRAHHDGTDLVEVVGSGLTNGSGTATIASFSVAPDGVKLAFSANCPDANIYEVFVLDLTSSSADPIQVSDVGALKPPSGLSGLAFQSPINWSPDSEELAVVADWRLDTNDQDDAFSAFLLPTAAPGGLRVVGAPQGSGLNAREVFFADDGASLIVRGDLIDNGTFELYVVEDFTLEDQNPLDVRFEEVPTQGDVVGVVKAR